MIILVTTRVAPSIGMTIACGADVTTIKKRRKGIFQVGAEIKKGNGGGEESLDCQDATDASLIRRKFVGPARISLVSWRGPNYMAEATNELYTFAG